MKKLWMHTTRAISLAPEDPEVWYRRGMALREMKAYEDAMDDFEKAIRLYEKSYDMSSMSASEWCKKGMGLCKIKSYQEALMLLTGLLS